MVAAGPAGRGARTRRLRLLGVAAYSAPGGSAPFTLGSGSTLPGSCQGDRAIEVDLDREFDDGAYDVVGVRLSRIDEACIGFTYLVGIDTSGGRHEASGVVTGSEVVAALGASPAADVTAVSVVIAPR